MMKQKNFQIRALSALVALAIIFAAYSFWAVKGLKYIIVFAVTIGTFELSKILFHGEKSSFLKYLFIILSLLIFAASIASLSIGSLAYSLFLIVMIAAILLTLHNDGDLKHMLSFHMKASLGFFYIGLLPSFAFRILDQFSGLYWFIFLLSVVFAGDIFAYIFGVLLGKHKMMPLVSPKKTWEGSFGGIFGSIGASLICWNFFFTDQSLWFTLTLGAISGILGQFGDFFESLLKRVAEVKDSGKIMPGHGGILDRIDGVLFAGPVVLAGILILSHF
ncbi:MAG: phosphatidate cytidylyltransferase [Bdellovibrio sp.]